MFDMESYLKDVFAKKAIAAHIAMIEEDWEKTVFDLLRHYVTPWAWDDKGTDVVDAMYIKASTWKPKQLFPTPAWSGSTVVSTKYFRDHTEVCPMTKKDDKIFVYANRVLPRGRSLKVASSHESKGRVFFDGDIVTPVLFEMRDDGSQTTWMGLTPMEVLTQRSGLWQAQGRVVVGGLGLGWFLNEVCCRPEVTEVILVEKECHLMYWLKPVIEAAYPQIAVKCKQWANADVYEFMADDQSSRYTKDTTYLLDIWPGYGDCREDGVFKSWQARLKPEQLWGWGQ